MSSRQFHSALARRVLSTLHQMGILAAGIEFRDKRVPGLGVRRARGLKLRCEESIIFIRKQLEYHIPCMNKPPFVPGVQEMLPSRRLSKHVFEAKYFGRQGGCSREYLRTRPLKTCKQTTHDHINVHKSPIDVSNSVAYPDELAYCPFQAGNFTAR